ncbi:SCO2525 family SAM-dependent methyltransferase [Streptomyces sp. NBC_00199]|uniref:SCO2525 family SAM-dependent methyltransferase n=1 Tax=Streptomyces sp. NBC_00199 TaxID=2975678 RepID=UPI002253A3B4|nr:SCO2525 family SAM-dependent methyltransferase [Streptomyces sp. NBC_00199]MCX5263406.1 SCO2525 family SAM-dependent methyltransferase [Streptomyces sp. NBC_00199]
MSLGSPEKQAQLQAQALWDSFDTAAYVHHNYETVLDVDAKIMSIVRAHFSDHFRDFPDLRVRGIDVGAGANLYPSFLMLPWCHEITLLDRSSPNLDYLQRQLKEEEYGRSWDTFWHRLCRDDAYAALPGGPWPTFREIAQVEQGNLLALAERPRQWQLGTMFFVAESLSTAYEEIPFDAAVACFMECLTPGAPFAAAFMEHSQGYWVGQTFFPAHDVGKDHIRRVVGAHAYDLRIHRVGEPGEVRSGYTGMILACGFRKPGTSETAGTAARSDL